MSLRVEQDELTQSIQRTIVALLSELANVEHKQKMERIESGIRAAQAAGKWTGRAPRGFQVDDDGNLLVETGEFVNVRRALERIVVYGEPVTRVAESSGIPESTLRTLRDERLDWYFAADADDDRVDAALDDVRPVDEIDAGDPPDLDELDELADVLEDRLRDRFRIGETAVDES